MLLNFLERYKVNSLININQSLTMSSKEMSVLTEKRHDSVKRTIDTLLEKGVISKPQIVDGEKSANGVIEKLYLVGKRDSYIIVAQLSPEFTARLVDRWQELENQQAKPKQLTNRELALMVIQEADRADKAEATVKRLIFNDTYLITNNGFIVSMPKKWAVGCNGGNKSHNGKVLSQVLVNGYLKVRIKYPDGERKMVSVHRLIAQAFIPNPENKPQVNHINGIKTDNRVENLEWVTAKENNTHAILNELTHVKKGKNSNAKPVINTLGKIYECARDADDSLNYKYGTVSKSIRRGNLCGGVKWAFIPAEWTMSGREWLLDVLESL